MRSLGMFLMLVSVVRTMDLIWPKKYPDTWATVATVMGIGLALYLAGNSGACL